MESVVPFLGVVAGLAVVALCMFFRVPEPSSDLADARAERDAALRERDAAVRERDRALSAMLSAQQSHKDVLGVVAHSIDQIVGLKREGFAPPPEPLRYQRMDPESMPPQYEELVSELSKPGTQTRRDLESRWRPGMSENEVEDLIASVRRGSNPDAWGEEEEDDDE